MEPVAVVIVVVIVVAVVFVAVGEGAPFLEERAQNLVPLVTRRSCWFVLQ